jgi:hypothetical protein
MELNSDTLIRHAKREFRILPWKRSVVLSSILLIALSLSIASSLANGRQIRLQSPSTTTPLNRSLSHLISEAAPLSASPSLFSANAEGKTTSLRVITRRKNYWNVSNSNSWIIIKQVNGRGSKRVTFSVSPNTDCASRTGTFSINGRSVTIHQASATKNYFLSATEARFSAQAAAASVTLNAECAWTVQTDAGWISTIAPASDNGDGNAIIVYSVAANSEEIRRIGTIKILDGNSVVRQTLSVTQEGVSPSDYSFFPASGTFPANGGNGTMQLSAPENAAWSLKPGRGIINLFPSSGTGSASITFSVLPNSSCDLRSNSIVVLDANSAVQKTFSIVQAEGIGTFSLSTNALSISASGDSNSVYLATGKTCNRMLQSDAEWIHLPSTNGIGSALVSVLASSNPGPARSASIRILDSNFAVRETIVVTQPQASVSYSLSSSYLIFTANGGNVSVGLAANATWTAEADVNWITGISPATGNGSSVIDYSVAANTSSSSRTGSIRILDGDSVVQQTLRITQSGLAPSFEISPASENFTATGGSGVATLKANSSWKTLVDVNWIHSISPGESSGDASIHYAVSPNTNTTARASSIRILDANFVVKKTLLITQEGAPENYSLASSTNSPAEPGQYRWSATLGSAGGDIGNAVATDSHGNIFTAGNIDGFIFLEKYSATGTLIWSKMFYDNRGSANAVAVDRDDNVVLAGTFNSWIDFGGGPLSSAGENDLFVAKYSGDGAHLWSKRMGGSEGNDTAHGVAIDSIGNVVLTGTIVGSVEFGGSATFAVGPFDNDIVLAKFAGENGSFVWAKRFASTASDNGLGVAIGPQDEIVFTGNFSGPINFGGGVLASAGQDVFVAQFSPSGEHLWSRGFGGALDDSGNAVAIDANDNIILTGAFAGTIDFGGGALNSADENYDDIFLTKLSGDGSHLWSKNFGGTIIDSGNAVAVDRSGNVALAGSFSDSINLGGDTLNSAGGVDVFLAKYSPDGSPLWSKAFGAETGSDSGCAVAVDNQNNIIGAGGFFSAVDFGGGPQISTGNGDMFLISLAP